jgi:8-oxo-dGTP pyrophosphatase MutT (NUDIX family)
MLGVVFLALSLWRYVDQRLKGVNQAYWYVLALEAATSEGYRDRGADRMPNPPRAGGVVYRRRRARAEYLIVEAKETRDDWVFPKGHVESEEDMAETAVREVVEETGTWARVACPLDIISFEIKDEFVRVQFYLMQALGHRKPDETRRIQWLPVERAVDVLSHEESRRLLRMADEMLARAPANFASANTERV